MQIDKSGFVWSMVRGIAVGVGVYMVWPKLGEGLGLEGDLWRYGVAFWLGLLVFIGSTQKFQRGPRRGEFWMAEVPFSDGTGSKDRPCLVTGRAGWAYTVLYVTSKDKAGDTNYIRVDNSGWTGHPNLVMKSSWMRVAERDGSEPSITVDRSEFRRKLGRLSKQDEATLGERQGTRA